MQEKTLKVPLNRWAVIIPRAQWTALRKKIQIEAEQRKDLNGHELTLHILNQARAAQADPVLEFFYEVTKYAIQRNRIDEVRKLSRDKEEE